MLTFRNTFQRRQALAALLAMVGVESWWTNTNGLSAQMSKRELSSGQKAILDASLAIIADKSTIMVPVDTSDDPKTAAAVTALIELLSLKSTTQIDTWIAKHRPAKSKNPQLTSLCQAKPAEWARIVIDALEATRTDEFPKGNAEIAARQLNVSPRTMRRWLHHEEIARLAPQWVPRTDR